jgi:DNA repair exonuclease SbcCD ATPase subunit
VEHDGAVPEEKLAALRASVEAAGPETTRQEGLVAQGEEALARHDARLATLREQQRALQERRKAVLAAQTALRAAEDALGQLRSRASAPAGESREAVEARFAETRGSLSRAREALRAVEAYHAAVAAARAAVGKRERLRGEASAYEAMEHACRPSGLPARLLLPALGPVRLRLERWAPLLGGLHVALTDECEVVVTRDGHPMRLSGSERWRVSVALADALAQLSGLRFLALDEVSLLDAGNRTALVEMLMSVSSDYDQVIVLAVLGEREPRQAPEGSGARVYRVSGGAVEPVGEEVAP